MTSPFLKVPCCIYTHTLEHPTIYSTTENSKFPQSFANFLPIFLYRYSKLIDFIVTQDQSQVLFFFLFLSTLFHTKSVLVLGFYFPLTETL